MVGRRPCRPHKASLPTECASLAPTCKPRIVTDQIGRFFVQVVGGGRPFMVGSASLPTPMRLGG
jgi:hypothetical protein